MWALLKIFSWQELRHHPWRNGAAVLAVALGVALAFSVHLINANALAEFSQAARSVNGKADLQVRALQGSLDESMYRKLAHTPGVALALPVLDIQSYVLLSDSKPAIRVVGVDVLKVFDIAPALMPQPSPNAKPADSKANNPRARWSILAPGQIFLNTAAQALLPQHLRASPQAQQLTLQNGQALVFAHVAGRVQASGPALGVMDIGAAQELFAMQGQLSQIGLKLNPGMDPTVFARTLQQSADWPAHLSITEDGDAQSQISNLSRAYRVNLAVLAMIALFTGAFLVFSVLSLSVAKRAQQFALLGVLGLSAQSRLRLVLAESLLLGALGSTIGIGLGTALAALALHLLGGDLGGGFFSGAAPVLHLQASSAMLYGLLGVGAAVLGGWWPARTASKLPLAQTLKGLGHLLKNTHSAWLSLSFLVIGALLTQMPAVWGIALAAYISVAMLLFGGITGLPWLIETTLAWASPKLAHRTLALLALERARRQGDTVSSAVSSVVASLSLAVALTVMVASFRDSVTQWLDAVLPADLYLRSARSLSSSNMVYFTPEFVKQAGKLEGVRTLQAQRQVSVLLQPNLPAVSLMVRELRDPVRELPLLAPPLPVPKGTYGIYVSEALVDLHHAKPGTYFETFGRAFSARDRPSAVSEPRFFVAGVWRDYARQTGAIVMDQRDYANLSDDRLINDLAFWLDTPQDAARVEANLRTLANTEQAGAGQLLEFGTSTEIRAVSLGIFDRSFAVTYWLQGVAIVIGLFGVAASFSAQVLSRRKEFGLLTHLGLTRRQILSLVAIEGATWTTLGAVAGLGLGLLVALVLVHVINPQSFHWTMDLSLPWWRLLALALAVVVSGTVTAWLAGRAAASHDAVLAVKEDW